MFNKFYKIIHNKYSRFFGFIFFLRYLFLIFLISITLFLTIPNFFDYEKRSSILKNYLHKNYNLKISKYEKIEFHSLPVPRLELKNVQINFEEFSTNLTVKKLKIFPKIINILNYNNFQVRKIILQKNNININLTDLLIFSGKIFKQKNKISIYDLDLQVFEDKNPIIKIENLNFANYGYNKNFIQGFIFKKKFESKIKKNLSGFNFSLINSGVSFDIEFDKNKNREFLSGLFKSKILNTNSKSEFNFDYKILNIKNFFFRSKNLSLKTNGLITFDPFLDIDLKSDIEAINIKILENFEFAKIIKLKNSFKNLNFKNQINFKSKKFSRNLIDSINLKTDLAYGRLFFSKNVEILDSFVQCKGDVNLFEDYPSMFFDCKLTVKDKKKFFGAFSLKPKKIGNLELHAKGNLNILNRKVNFDMISMNENYSASEEDLKYYKDTFENIIFDESFLRILDFKKIKKFIVEIS